MKLTYKNNSKERLDKFLANELKDTTRSQIKKLILSGAVLVNKKKPSVHEWLHADDIVEVKLKNAETIKQREINVLEPQIIFEDDDYLVLNKPSGLLVHPTNAAEKNTLIAWLLKKYPQLKKFGDQQRPGLVHRLDKDVSGLIMIALNQKSYNHFKKLFQTRKVEKHYTALVNGKILNQEGTIDTNLDRDKKTGKMKAVSDLHSRQSDSGKTAITKYQVLKQFINYTLLDVQIITGRTHQIRSHLASIGHSIVGDKLYATKDIRKSRKEILKRPFLHASSIKFQDPDGQIVNYKSKLPADLEKFIKTLK